MAIKSDGILKGRWGDREKSQSGKIDLEIDKDIPVPIIIDW